MEREIGSVPESEIIRGGQEVHDKDKKGQLEIGEVDAQELLLEPDTHHNTNGQVKIEKTPEEQIDRGDAAKALHKPDAGLLEVGAIDPSELLTDSEENNPENYKAA